MSYKHILMAVDLSQSSQTVINKAISVAKDAKCNLSMVYVNADRVAMTQKEKLDLNQELQTLVKQSDYPVTGTIVVIGDIHIKLAGIV